MNKSPPTVYTITTIAKQIGATTYAVKKYLNERKINPVAYSDKKKSIGLYPPSIIKKMAGCKLIKEKSKKASTVVKSMRFKTTQWDNIKRYIDKSGLSFTDVMMNGLKKSTKLETKITHVQVANPELLKHLSMIGNNLNQLAKAMNYAKRQGIITSGLATACYATLADVEDQMSQLI